MKKPHEVDDIIEHLSNVMAKLCQLRGAWNYGNIDDDRLVQLSNQEIEGLKTYLQNP